MSQSIPFAPALFSDDAQMLAFLFSFEEESGERGLVSDSTDEVLGRPSLTLVGVARDCPRQAVVHLAQMTAAGPDEGRWVRCPMQICGSALIVACRS